MGHGAGPCAGLPVRQVPLGRLGAAAAGPGTGPGAGPPAPTAVTRPPPPPPALQRLDGNSTTPPASGLSTHCDALGRGCEWEEEANEKRTPPHLALQARSHFAPRVARGAPCPCPSLPHCLSPYLLGACAADWMAADLDADAAATSWLDDSPAADTTPLAEAADVGTSAQGPGMTEPMEWQPEESEAALQRRFWSLQRWIAASLIETWWRRRTEAPRAPGGGERIGTGAHDAPVPPPQWNSPATQSWDPWHFTPPPATQPGATLAVSDSPAPTPPPTAPPPVVQPGVMITVPFSAAPPPAPVVPPPAPMAPTLIHAGVSTSSHDRAMPPPALAERTPLAGGPPPPVDLISVSNEELLQELLKQEWILLEPPSGSGVAPTAACTQTAGLQHAAPTSAAYAAPPSLLGDAAPPSVPPPSQGNAPVAGMAPPPAGGGPPPDAEASATSGGLAPEPAADASPPRIFGGVPPRHSGHSTGRWRCTGICGGQLIPIQLPRCPKCGRLRPDQEVDTSTSSSSPSSGSTPSQTAVDAGQRQITSSSKKQGFSHNRRRQQKKKGPMDSTSVDGEGRSSQDAKSNATKHSEALAEFELFCKSS